MNSLIHTIQRFRLRVHPIALFVVVMSLCLLQGCGSKESTSENETSDPIVVEGVRADHQSIRQKVTYTGTLVANRVVNAGSNAPARIEEIFVEEGDRVAVGDPLFRMEENQLRQARIAHETAKREYERLLPLAEEGAVTRQQVEMAKSDLDQAGVNLEVLEENTLFRAPHAGIVSEKWFEEGELYSAAPTEFGAPGILQLVEMDPLKLIINVNESHLRFLQKGDSVDVRVDAYPGDLYQSIIHRIFPTVDPSNRTARVEIRIDNDSNLLRPGQFSRVGFHLQTVEGIAIPRAALLRGTSSNAQDVLFYVTEDGEAIRQVVSVGPRMDDLVLIEEGLSEGAFVVVKGKQRLENGMQVETARFDAESPANE
ncbi:MAG: efflux RND transporter periplasmic adaptor subunit [Balneolaceae bacterium]